MFYIVIHIKGKLDPSWSDWFEDMKIIQEPAGVTMLCGNLPDKAAVYGVISRLCSLGITLVSVQSTEEMDIGPTTQNAIAL